MSSPYTTGGQKKTSQPKTKRQNCKPEQSPPKTNAQNNHRKTFNTTQDVWVGSLPRDVKCDVLQREFSKYGQVGKITLKSKECYAFVQFLGCKEDMVDRLKNTKIVLQERKLQFNYPIRHNDNNENNIGHSNEEDSSNEEKKERPGVRSTANYFLLGYLSDSETFNMVETSEDVINDKKITSIEIKHNFRSVQICLNTSSCSYSIEIALKDIIRINLTKKEFAIQWQTAPKIFFEEGNTRRSIMDIFAKNIKCNAMVLFIDAKDHRRLHNIIKYIKNVENKLKIINNNRDVIPYPKELPIHIVLLLEALISKNTNRYSMTQEFFDEISQTNENALLRALLIMQDEEEIFDPLQALRDKIQLIKNINPTQLNERPSSFYPSNPDLVPTFHLMITPTKYYIEGVFYEVSNRVQRIYPKNIFNFLRVMFLDENFSPMNNMGKDIKRQFKKIVDHGIYIGQWKFLFLAYSNSQLRQRSCFFMTEFTYNGAVITREKIFNELGTFSKEKIPAKVGARIGPNDYQEIADVEIKVEKQDGKIVKYTFTDGIGRISPEYAKYCADKRGLKYVPCAFQIRFKGYKGMVVIDPNLKEKKLELRASMKKFDSDHNEFEIVGHSSYHPAYLNRQIITLLVSLGVTSRKGFERLETLMIEDALAVINGEKNIEECINFVKKTNPNDYTTNILSSHLPIFGLNEPYLKTILRLFCQKLMNDMISRTRIHVPDGALLYGVIDETGCLAPNEVYVKVNGKVITKKAFVTRNPCLDPGDIRVVQCVDKEKLSHLENVVVFSKNGNRPLMDMMAGGDLDGDFYTVVWDQDLIPLNMREPAEYPKPVIKPKAVKYPHDVANFFVEYIDRDVIGLVDTSWQAFAEERGLDASVSKCVDMAKKHAIGIDFAKTGIPCEYTDSDWAQKYPEYMEKHKSISFNGKSFISESFKRLMKHKKETAPKIDSIKVDATLLCEGFADYVAGAKALYLEYVEDNMRILRQYGIQSEAEIMTGNILKCSKRFAKKKDYATRENLGTRLSQVREYYIHKFNEDFEALNDAKEVITAKKMAKAAAWYFVAYESCVKLEAHHVPMLGFAWLNAEYLSAIKQQQNRF